MTDGVRLLYQLRRLAEVSVRTSGVDHGVDFALTDNRPRKHRSARFGRDGQRFARQRRLVDLNRIARQQARICRHNVAQSQADDVARYKLGCIRIDPLPIALHRGLDRQFGPECGDGVARLVFFPESDHGIGTKKKEDDKKIQPVPDQPRQNHRRFNHPRDRTPEISKEFQERIGFLFFNLISAVLSKTFLRLGLTEALRR